MNTEFIGFKKFDDFYNKIINDTNKVKFNFENIDRFGQDNVIITLRHGCPRKAIQAKQPGAIVTRETKLGETTSYDASDWILTDEQGGQYPVKNDVFIKLYDISNPLPNDMYKPFERKVKFFRVDRPISIDTEWGTYEAMKGDFITLNDDGSLGCPVKPDAMTSGYEFIAYENDIE